MSNNKQMIIKAPDGQIIDMEHFKKTNEVIFIDEIPEKLPFPENWGIKNGTTVYYINTMAELRTATFENDNRYYNSYPTEKLAKQSVVFAKLIMMREEYRRIELHNDPNLTPIDWSDNKTKYIIELFNGTLNINTLVRTHAVFSFLKRETCNEFLKHYSKAILYCKDLLG